MTRLAYGLRTAVKATPHVCKITNLSKLPRLWISKTPTNVLPEHFPQSHASQSTIAKLHLLYYDYTYDDFVLTHVYESDSRYYGYTYLYE